MSQPSHDPVVQALQVFFSGTGYNFYNVKNQMRADDLLVRHRAAGMLADAARGVATVEAEFRRRFIPAATRENPDPPADALEGLRALGRLRARLDDGAGRMTGMPAPTQDKTWWRHREEAATLAHLLDLDYRLMLHSDALARLTRDVTADAWHRQPAVPALDAAFAALEDIIREREQFLRAL